MPTQEVFRLVGLARQHVEADRKEEALAALRRALQVMHEAKHATAPVEQQGEEGGSSSP